MERERIEALLLVCSADVRLDHESGQAQAKGLPGGVRVDVPLTHSVLARLVGARRPTVTTALQRLTQLDYLRREGRCYTLLGDAGRVAELEAQSPSRDGAVPSRNGASASRNGASASSNGASASSNGASASSNGAASGSAGNGTGDPDNVAVGS